MSKKINDVILDLATAAMQEAYNGINEKRTPEQTIAKVSKIVNHTISLIFLEFNDLIPTKQQLEEVVSKSIVIDPRARMNYRNGFDDCRKLVALGIHQKFLAMHQPDEKSFENAPADKTAIQGPPSQKLIKGYAGSRRVFVENDKVSETGIGLDREIDSKVSQDVYNHSPDGFEWGYSGSGPAQLALAILLEFTTPEKALALHQIFKSSYIACLDKGKDFTLIYDKVAEWVEEQLKKIDI